MEHKKLSQCRCMDNHGKCSCGWEGKGINAHIAVNPDVDESDPVKQMIVMRDDINMGPGKMVAQGAHAAISFLTKEHRQEGSARIFLRQRLTEAETLWIVKGFTKVCVVVHSEQELLDIHKAAQTAGLKSNLIVDEGRTVFDGVPTATCCAIGPDFSSKINKITGNLPLLP